MPGRLRLVAMRELAERRGSGRYECVVPHSHFNGAILRGRCRRLELFARAKSRVTWFLPLSLYVFALVSPVADAFHLRFLRALVWVSRHFTSFSVLRFPQPGKCLYTTIRELVENALDAAEGSAILPDVSICIEEISEAKLNDLRGIENIARVDKSLYADYKGAARGGAAQAAAAVAQAPGEDRPEAIESLLASQPDSQQGFEPLSQLSGGPCGSVPAASTPPSSQAPLTPTRVGGGGAGGGASSSSSQSYFVVTVKDNGCGMSREDIPEMLGRVLSGTKYGVAQTRGKFGLGAKMALIWAKMSTGLPIHVRSSTGGDSPISVVSLDIDIRANRPKVLESSVELNVGKWRGSQVSTTIAGNWQYYRAKVLKYLQLVAIITPHANVTFQYIPDPSRPSQPLQLSFARRTDAAPRPPRTVPHHPSSVDLERVRRLARQSDAKDLVSFLTTDFACVSRDLAKRLVEELRAGGFGTLRGDDDAALDPNGDKGLAGAIGPKRGKEATKAGKGQSAKGAAKPIARTAAKTTQKKAPARKIPAESDSDVISDEPSDDSDGDSGGDSDFDPSSLAGKSRKKAQGGAKGAKAKGAKGAAEAKKGKAGSAAATAKQAGSRPLPSSSLSVATVFSSSNPKSKASRSLFGKEEPLAVGADSVKRETPSVSSSTTNYPLGPPPRLLDARTAARLHSLLRSVRFPDPSGDHLSPAGEYNLRLGISKEVLPDLVATASLEPRVSEGHAFQVEAGVALGGRRLKPGLTVARFANRVPLLFEAGSDVATRTASKRVPWTAYKINPTTDKVGVFVSIVSTKIPFKGAGKEYVADDVPELAAAVRQALLQCAAQLRGKLARQQAAREQVQRRRVLARYVPDVARAVYSLLSAVADSRDERGARKETNEGSARKPARGGRDAGAATPTRSSSRSASSAAASSSASAFAVLEPQKVALLEAVRAGGVTEDLLAQRLREHVERADATMAFEYAMRQGAAKGTKIQAFLRGGGVDATGVASGGITGGTGTEGTDKAVVGNVAGAAGVDLSGALRAAIGTPAVKDALQQTPGKMDEGLAAQPAPPSTTGSLEDTPLWRLWRGRRESTEIADKELADASATGDETAIDDDVMAEEKNAKALQEKHPAAVSGPADDGAAGQKERNAPNVVSTLSPPSSQPLVLSQEADRASLDEWSRDPLDEGEAEVSKGAPAPNASQTALPLTRTPGAVYAILDNPVVDIALVWSFPDAGGGESAEAAASQAVDLAQEAAPSAPAAVVPSMALFGSAASLSALATPSQTPPASQTATPTKRSPVKSSRGRGAAKEPASPSDVEPTPTRASARNAGKRKRYVVPSDSDVEEWDDESDDGSDDGEEDDDPIEILD